MCRYVCMCIEHEELSQNDVMYKELALIHQIACLCLPTILSK